MLYNEMVKALIDSYGQPITFTYETDPVFDPVTGGQTTTTETLEGTAYIKNYEEKDIDGESIRRSDLLAYIAPMAEIPKEGWTAEINGTTYVIQNSQRVQKEDVSIFYKCQLRI